MDRAKRATFAEISNNLCTNYLLNILLWITFCKKFNLVVRVLTLKSIMRKVVRGGDKLLFETSWFLLRVQAQSVFFSV
jgi:hypothetical protein